MKHIKNFENFSILEGKKSESKDIRDVIIKIGKKYGLKFKDIKNPSHVIDLAYDKSDGDYDHSYYIKLVKQKDDKYTFEYGCASWSKSKRHGELSGDSGMSKKVFKCTIDDCEDKISKALGEL